MVIDCQEDLLYAIQAKYVVHRQHRQALVQCVIRVVSFICGVDPKV